MAKKMLADFMSDSHPLGKATLSNLRLLVERYPYYHAARLLYVRALYRNHDEDFDTELHKAAIYVPSRRVLYTIIEGEKLKPVLGSKAKGSPAAQPTDRTASLIDQFLEGTTEDKPRRKSKVDASVDYIEFLRQNEADSEVLTPQQTETGGMDVIGEFLSKTGRIVLHERSDEEMLKPEQADEAGGESSVLTETMAKIYIKQQKYGQALEIISRLSLKFPKKSRYFADQIRFLEKLVLNDKYKQNE
ncbi:MAG: hypothetical protein LUC86_07955 [Prevotellaceae bacterium]|nr:hypothetical protein [Prevotellaceae bacterium]MCD8285350.1 hypothetical protein [Prevotellaceae bacterium]MCD8304740.1 hypothetical protein [Prevotellaceae bacterium]